MLEALREWSLMLVITAFAGGISSFVVSETNKTMKKYVKLACSVVALAVMTAPISGLLKELPEVFKGDESPSVHEYSRSAEKTGEWILTKSIDDLKSGISNTIYQKFGIKTSNVYIYIKQDSIETEGADGGGLIDKSLEIEKIRIEISQGELYSAASSGGVMGDSNSNNNNDEVAEEIKKYLMNLLECEIIVDVSDF